MAKAIKTIRKQLQKLSQVRYLEVDASEYGSQTAKRTPRGQLLMHGIIVGDRLQYRIEVHLASINTDPKELVGETGLAQNFYSKIKLARGLQVIDEVVAERLDIIRLLRNAAAHAHGDLTFDHPTISSAIDDIVHPFKTTSEDRHIAYAARTTYLGWDAESDGKWYRTVDHLLKLREFAASVPVQPSPPQA